MTEIPVSYAVPSERTSPKFCEAFALGCGGPVETGERLLPGSVAMFGSPQRWALLQDAFRTGRTVWYGDHAYFSRTKFYRITRDAYQHTGTSHASPKRFLAHRRPVQPWRRDGRHVLICPNSLTYFGLFGLDVHQWVRDVTATIGGVSQRPVRVRWKGQQNPIESDLQNCWAVVAFSSAAALDALIAGVPVFVLADFAAAYRLGLHDVAQIETPIYPDGREPFLWSLADNQWTLDEIRDGIAWRALNDQAVAA